MTKPPLCGKVKWIDYSDRVEFDGVLPQPIPPFKQNIQSEYIKINGNRDGCAWSWWLCPEFEGDRRQIAKG